VSFDAFNAGYVVGGLSGLVAGALLSLLVRVFVAHAPRARVLGVLVCSSVVAGLLWLVPGLAQAAPAGVVCSGLPVNPGQTVTGTGAGSPCVDGPGLMTIHYASGTDLFEAWGNGSSPSCPADAWYCNWLGVSSVVSWGTGFGSSGGGGTPDPGGGGSACGSTSNPCVMSLHPFDLSAEDGIALSAAIVGLWAVAWSFRAVFRVLESANPE